MRVNCARSTGKAGQAGFTLIEIATVLLIIAIMTALAVPSVTRYRMSEQTRESTQVVASALRQARASALKDGVQYFVIFNPDVPPAVDGTVARLVRDVDGDWAETAPDRATDYGFNPGTSSDIQPYGLGSSTPFSSYGPAPGDPGGNLATVTEGASFPNDPNTGRPAVGFTAQGVPVSLATPTSWGTGAGAFYVTDGSAAVYAVVVGPLGEVRVRALNPGTGEWQ